jgi:hypothetical protein
MVQCPKHPNAGFDLDGHFRCPRCAGGEQPERVEASTALGTALGFRGIAVDQHTVEVFDPAAAAQHAAERLRAELPELVDQALRLAAGRLD